MSKSFVDGEFDMIDTLQFLGDILIKKTKNFYNQSLKESKL